MRRPSAWLVLILRGLLVVVMATVDVCPQEWPSALHEKYFQH